METIPVRKRHEILSFHGSFRAVYTVSSIRATNSGRSFSLYIQEDIYLADQPVQLSRTFRKTKYTVTINSNRIDFLKDYPQCDFQSLPKPRRSKVREEILKQIAPQIEPLSTGDALNWLLHFTQSAFQYATDHAQFGHEEYLFPEETFFYPKSDCEDRAIFFAWIVRRTLNLEVALMSYKDHGHGSYPRSRHKRHLYPYHRQTLPTLRPHLHRCEHRTMYA